MDQVQNTKQPWFGWLQRIKPYSRHLGLGLLGLVLVLVGSFYDRAGVNQTTREVEKAPLVQPRTVEELLEAKLANLLSQVKGAGAVAVQVTLESGASQEFAKNVTHETKTIQEKDGNGGIRTTTENKEVQQILVGKENGADKPVMVKEIKPVIKGVMVIAEGAGDSEVKANLTRAVETGLGVPAYKVTVLPQRR